MSINQGPSKVSEELKNRLENEQEQARLAIANGDLSQIRVLSLFHTISAQASVDLKGPKGIFLEDSNLARANAFLSSPTENKFSKKQHAVPFSVVKANNNKRFIVYGGENFVIARGLHGCIKLAQDAETGKTCFVKISVSVFNDLENENIALTKLGRSSGYLERTNKRGRSKQYIFMDAIPGLTAEQFNETLEMCHYQLSKAQQCQILLSLIREYKRIISKGIRHGDSHRRNMILTGDLNVTMIDFGLCSFVTDPEANMFQLVDFYQMLTAVRPLIQDPQLKAKIADYSSNDHQRSETIYLRIVEINPLKMREFIQEFETYLTDELKPAPSADPITPLRRLKKRSADKLSSADEDAPVANDEVQPTDKKGKKSAYDWGCVCF